MLKMALVALLLVAPTVGAVAMPGALLDEVRVPDPSATGYYIRVRPTEVEAPRSPHANEETDCAASDRPGSMEEGALRVIDPILGMEKDPREFYSIHEPYPECVALPLGFASACIESVVSVCASPGYAAYDTTTGRYHIEGDDIGSEDIPLGFAARFVITGSTGIGGDADCETCPPPFDIAP